MFSRGNRTSGRHARSDRSRHERARPSHSLADEQAAGDGAAGDDSEPVAAADDASDVEPAGPYDSSTAPTGVRRLDLGSLQIPSVPGVEVRVQANKEGVVQQVFLLHGESTLQLGAFAAPRTEPIWDEVRADIRKSLFDDGVAVEEVPGRYGTELRARVRTKEGLKDLRFVGVSGPRWMVRAVYQGPAAVDPEAAGPLLECLRGLVVERDHEARPAREPLPLRLSPELANQVSASAAAASAGGGAGTVPPAAGGTPPSSGTATGGTAPGASAPRRKPSPRPRRQAPDPERYPGRT